MAPVDAAPLNRDAPQVAARAAGAAAMRAFEAERLPQRRACSSDLIQLTMSEIGKTVAEQARTAIETETFTDTTADMFCRS